VVEAATNMFYTTFLSSRSSTLQELTAKFPAILDFLWCRLYKTSSNVGGQGPERRLDGVFNLKRYRDV